MYGLVKKNDGTYALTEFVHYGKGHLDGGHSGRYPWGSGRDPESVHDGRQLEDAKTANLLKYKKVRFVDNQEKSNYIKSSNVQQDALHKIMFAIGIGNDSIAKKHKAQYIDLFNKEIGLYVDRELSDPRGYEQLVKDSKVFISGSSKTQNPKSPFYQKELPKAVRNMIDHCVINETKILVGDAPGIDSQVQDYLKNLNYEKVIVYSPFKKPRYIANEKWKKKEIPGELFKKDEAMTKDADTGIAVVIEGGAEATRNNVKRLNGQGKTAIVYEISSNKYEEDEKNKKLEKESTQTGSDDYLKKRARYLIR